MSNKIVAFALTCCAFTSFSVYSRPFADSELKPQKVWVFLTDKKEAAPKAGQMKNFARRTRTRVDRKWVSRLDAPVSREYADVLRSRGAKIRAVSKWFNAVSVEASPKALREIASLPFVLRMEAVAGATRPKEPVQPSAPSLAL